MSKVYSDGQKKFLQELLAKRPSVPKRKDVKDGEEEMARRKRLRQKTVVPKDGRQSHNSESNRSTNTPTKNRSQSLADKSKKRLATSHFRAMNESLYTTTATEAGTLMNPDSFTKYHETYREIAEKWPVKPIDHIIEMIKGMKQKNLVISDMGCGDKPMIAEAFPGLTVHSFDLISTDERISPSSIDKIPLKNQTCDVVVFSLSLMASNLSPVMKEASRIVKTGGHVIIAEVASRFEAKGPETDTVESFKSKLEKYFGLHVKSEEKLPPNSFFLVFKFVKKEFQPKLREATPSISLEACHYKPR